LLLPEPDAPVDELEAEVDLRRFTRSGSQVCSEVVSIRLRGNKVVMPASIVEPLLRSDLPAFLRWRGPLPFGEAELEQLVDLADRLIIDSTEWPDAAGAFVRLRELFPRIAVSDIGWSRLLPWREALAGRWPAIGDASRLRVRAPIAEALLLAGWLRARLARNVELEHESAGEIESVEVEGDQVELERAERLSPSALLSAQLEIFGRDPIYEEAVCSFTSPTTSSR
jgi:glucose-6-phosphate dehydrogenase assembly protein OpcA